MVPFDPYSGMVHANEHEILGANNHLLSVTMNSEVLMVVFSLTHRPGNPHPWQSGRTRLPRDSMANFYSNLTPKHRYTWLVLDEE